MRPKIVGIFHKITFVISLIGLFVLISDFGFEQHLLIQIYINEVYLIVLLTGLMSTLLRYLAKRKTVNKQASIFDYISTLVILIVICFHFFSEQSTQHLSLFYDDIWMKLAILLTFVREVSELDFNYKRTIFNPAQLFIISFLLLIFFGALLLMLPKATNGGLGLLDALFTSTSAVCVTGLIVVDTGTYFTQFGQTILLILIQLGGLGILTFASYFSYFFKDGATYENQLVIGDITNANKLGEVFTTLKRILFITFIVEITGALLVYSSLENWLFNSVFDKIFFAVFHSISAFCNAGFSTLKNSLYEDTYKYNYTLQIIIIAIYVLGGLGFPIVANIVKVTKYHFFNKVFRRKDAHYKPWILHLNSRISLITTAVLIVVGTLLFYVLEYHNTLVEHGAFGKFITALFGATTPRTSGFNTIDMGAMRVSTTLIVILLMWIGASPASTGGGIKTNTIAIAFLNFISLAKGKSRIEIYRREIADISIRRAFGVIALSIIVIGTGVILIAIFNENLPILKIVFECVSAYSTVGLSTGITSSLTNASKWVIITIMFIGRVSMLSILIAIIKKVKHKNYRYPSEEITIN